MKREMNHFLNMLLVVLIFLKFTACAVSTPVVDQSKTVSFYDGLEPLVQAKLGEVRFEPFNREMVRRTFPITYNRTSEVAERYLKNELHALLDSPGLFETSTENIINVKVEPKSLINLSLNSFRLVSNTEVAVKYEFRTNEGTVLIVEKITSQGSDGHLIGDIRYKNSLIKAISANIDKLAQAVKEKLPKAWKANAEKRDAAHRRIVANLKKENRYFKVTSTKATVRRMPDAGANVVTILAQAEIVHVVGSLPSGWFKVSQEGKSIGWVHSSFLQEDLAAAPSYSPIVALPSSLPPSSPPPVDMASLDFGSYHALVVGNNDYQFLPKLHTAVNDAREMGVLLQQKYGFKVRLLLNATRADVLENLNTYRRILTGRDNLLLYYAGHGWLDKDADEGYWLPVDATEDNPIHWISNGSITSSLRAMQAKHVLIVADSCYSGKLARGINIRIRSKNYFQKISRKKARTVMASGGLEPVADEGGKGQHSVFASAIIEALNENQGVLDATLLFSQIRRPVMVNTDQTPEYSDIHKAGHDGGDFLFVRQK
jgi:hypothetical protein